MTGTDSPGHLFVDIYTLWGYYRYKKSQELEEVIIMGEHLHEHAVVPRTDEEKDKVMNRLKRIEGQVRGIQKMVDEDRYCVDILVQISAIQSALKNVGYTVTERHMKHCVTDAITKGEGEDSIEELMAVLKQFSK